ncbi:SIS domain-containing protein [Mycoplasmatota bacterium]|nr:SIS domain-containing protein [Mycoplasmatota bacterium]
MNFKYIEKIQKVLKEIDDLEKDNISEAINLFVDAIIKKNNTFVFGASHAGIISEELFYRAGGLAVINPIFEPSIMLNVRPITSTSKMERLEGYGTLIANKTPITKGDVLLVHSVSGRNPVTIELAIRAKEMGAKIVAITNIKYSSSVESRHSSKLKLMDVADLVIDNHGELGDACIEIDGLEQKVSPTSTVVSASIANTIVSEVARLLMEKGITPPIFFSANIDGGDKHNELIFEKYKDMIHYL